MAVNFHMLIVLTIPFSRRTINLYGDYKSDIGTPSFPYKVGL